MLQKVTVTDDDLAFHPEKNLNLEANTRYT